MSGWQSINRELQEEGQAALGLILYLASGHFVSAVFENWESEFLQLGMYVVLTIFLFQKGASESKKLDEPNPEDEPPENAQQDPSSPWPVRQGGWILKVYSHSLSLALALLFLMAFCLHLYGSNRRMNDEALRHGKPLETWVETLQTSTFWYESFQNWQSEFLSIAVLILLGIFLRQRGSPESKPVAAPHHETGH